jgi:hypothetical protein
MALGMGMVMVVTMLVMSRDLASKMMRMGAVSVILFLPMAMAINVTEAVPEATV